MSDSSTPDSPAVPPPASGGPDAADAAPDAAAPASPAPPAPPSPEPAQQSPVAPPADVPPPPVTDDHTATAVYPPAAPAAYPPAPPAPPAAPQYPAAPAYGAAPVYGSQAPTFAPQAPPYGAQAPTYDPNVPPYGTVPPYGAAAGYYGAPAQPRTNGLAIVSLVASISAFLILPLIGSVVGVVTGHISLSQIKRTGEGGRGLALTGTILGWVGVGLLVLALFVLLALLPVFFATVHDIRMYR